MLNAAILAGVVGGLIWLDKFQVLQVMVSRPIVCAPILGWCLGDVSAGAATGVLFELLWLRRPPIGGFISPDSTFGAIAAAAISSWVVQAVRVDVTSAVFITFLAVFPVCYVGTRLDAQVRRYTGKIALRVETLQKEGKEGRVFAYFLLGLAIGFSMAFLLIFTTTLYGLLLIPLLLSALPARIVQAAGLAYYVAPLVGVADMLVGLHEKRRLILFFVGLVGTMCTLFLLGCR
ncbi:MAG: PTS sugar transporter subunit IIC [Desulfomonilaceae bacterium]